MRKIILFNLVSLDGFFSGPGGELDWFNLDKEFHEFADEQLKEAGGLLFGRKTYELMYAYWPTAEAIKNDPAVAEKMNGLPKIIFSKTVTVSDWNNTKFLSHNIDEEIKKIKQEKGKDIFLFGSADLASTLSNGGWIDEYRILINPVVLGKGIPLFKNGKDRLSLKLTAIKKFGSGNVLIYYQPQSSN